MSHNAASTVVNLPMPEVSACLGRVEGWQEFLDGVLEITKLSHDLYRFKVETATGVRERDVRIYRAEDGHRYSWKAIDGPRFTGVIHLSSVDGRRTLIKLSVIDMPYGIIASFTDMVVHREEAVVDLQRLERYVKTQHDLATDHGTEVPA
jgi:uncharacterized membrane protein